MGAKGHGHTVAPPDESERRAMAGYIMDPRPYSEQGVTWSDQTAVLNSWIQLPGGALRAEAERKSVSAGQPHRVRR